MKKNLILIFLIFAGELFATKYAGEIFNLGAEVKSQARGNTGLTDVNNFAPAYWNSALLPKIEQNKFELMHSEEYGGLLNHDTFSGTFGKKQKFSITISRIGIDDIPLTKLENPQDSLYYGNRPYKFTSVNNADYIAYFGFAHKLAQREFGITPKFIFRDLATENAYGFGFDVSTLFQLKENILAALKARDLFTTQIFWSNGTHEFVNPSLDSEISLETKLPIFNRYTRFIIRSEFYGEKRSTASKFDLNLFSIDPHFGLEMKAHPNLLLLGGFDINKFTMGLAFKWKNWFINYAFIHDTELENSQKISIGLIK